MCRRRMEPCVCARWGWGKWQPLSPSTHATKAVHPGRCRPGPRSTATGLLRSATPEIASIALTARGIIRVRSEVQPSALGSAGGTGRDSSARSPTGDAATTFPEVLSGTPPMGGQEGAPRGLRWATPCGARTRQRHPDGGRCSLAERAQGRRAGSHRGAALRRHVDGEHRRRSALPPRGPPGTAGAAVTAGTCGAPYRYLVEAVA